MRTRDLTQGTVMLIGLNIYGSHRLIGYIETNTTANYHGQTFLKFILQRTYPLIQSL